MDLILTYMWSLGFLSDPAVAIFITAGTNKFVKRAVKRGKTLDTARTVLHGCLKEMGNGVIIVISIFRPLRSQAVTGLHIGTLQSKISAVADARAPKQVKSCG